MAWISSSGHEMFVVLIIKTFARRFFPDQYVNKDYWYRQQWPQVWPRSRTMYPNSSKISRSMILTWLTIYASHSSTVSRAHGWVLVLYALASYKEYQVLVSYLGYIVSYEGVKVDPKKSNVIKEWKIPQP